MLQLTLPAGGSGIASPLRAYPETERHLNGLAQALLGELSSLTAVEREVIAACVSAANSTVLGTDSRSDKLKALLMIADKVRQGDRQITDEDIARARKSGADDMAIHDTVLIAAAFCMFNLYVDGLAAWASGTRTGRVAERRWAAETLPDSVLVGEEH
jgi:hypothetical protein